MDRALLLVVVGLIGACHLQPPAFPIELNREQNEALSAIYVSVWRDSRDAVNPKSDIERLLRAEADTIRDVLRDDQWREYDTVHRQAWVEKIYRTSRNTRSMDMSGRRPQVDNSSIVIPDFD